MTNYSNVHPGEILEKEFLEPFGITAYRLAKEIGVQQTRISLIIKGLRGISADTALRLSRYFGTTPEFWLNLQCEFDLRNAKNKKWDQIEQIEPLMVQKNPKKYNKSK